MWLAGGAVGHHRPVRTAYRAVPRAGRGAVHDPQRAAPQPDLRLHAVPLVRDISYRLPVVLPQLAGISKTMYTSVTKEI